MSRSDSFALLFRFMSFSSSFSLETLFSSAKIIHHESGINRIISHLRSWKIAKSFVIL